MVESNIKADTKEKEMENSPQRDDRLHNETEPNIGQIICPSKNHWIIQSNSNL